MSFRKMVLVPEQEMLQKAQLTSIPPDTKKQIQVEKKLENVFRADIPEDIKAKLVSEVVEKLQNMHNLPKYTAEPATQVINSNNSTNAFVDPKVIVENLPRRLHQQVSRVLQHIGKHLKLRTPQDISDVQDAIKYHLGHIKTKPKNWIKYSTLFQGLPQMPSSPRESGPSRHTRARSKAVMINMPSTSKWVAY